MNHKEGVIWHLVILGSYLPDAESTRMKQRLTHGWRKKAKVYAGEVPLAGGRLLELEEFAE
jgi:hypothetical protein